jgi:hypothetical protein
MKTCGGKERPTIVQACGASCSSQCRIFEGDFEVAGVGMFLERSDPNPRKAVHLLWSGEKVRPDYPLASPTVDERESLDPATPVVSLPGLVRMKLMSNRDQDRVHLRDLIGVGLITRDFLVPLPLELAARLDALLSEAGQ